MHPLISSVRQPKVARQTINIRRKAFRSLLSTAPLALPRFGVFVSMTLTPCFFDSKILIQKLGLQFSSIHLGAGYKWHSLLRADNVT
ncbi:MAG: hypothetical protein NT011_02495 [Kiritimatiellaeota bacterium]|nr:hypothetical protein [Kiritimatiellota bacterium]